jgi:ribonuclease HII
MKQTSLFEPMPLDKLALEAHARSQGFALIAGIDEAGRGALAGPVVAAAVIFPAGITINGVDDSKKLSAKKREVLFEEIMTKATSVGVGYGTAELIDRDNILQATRHAMLEAVTMISPTPDFLLIDGISTIESKIPQKTVKKGDSLSFSIAAASIIAKVTRDRLMQKLDAVYPGYGFGEHKGYGCQSHMDAIRLLRPTAVHRKTFAGVREHVI